MTHDARIELIARAICEAELMNPDDPLGGWVHWKDAARAAIAADAEFVWGAVAIAPYIGRTEKGAFHALESGKVPGAKKVAGRWGLHLPTFRASFASGH